MEADVLVYLNKLKKHLKENDEARKHFIGNFDENIFFEKVAEFAELNFFERGDPTLDVEQFEFIKKYVASLTIVERDDSYYEPRLFIDKRGMAKIIKKNK